MVVLYDLKIPSLEITVRHHSANLVMSNSYPRYRIFNPHLTIIKESYNLNHVNDDLNLCRVYDICVQEDIQ